MDTKVSLPLDHLVPEFGGISNITIMLYYHMGKVLNQKTYSKFVKQQLP